MTTQPQRPVPPHTAGAYDFVDVLDEIVAENRAGSAWAQALASDAITRAAALFPRAAKSVLGEQLIATHKSAAEQLPIRLKARYKVVGDPPPEVLAALDAAYTRLGSDWPATIAALQQLGAPAPAHARTLTDQGASTLVETKRMEMPPLLPIKKKAYDVDADLTARMLHADQLGRKP